MAQRPVTGALLSLSGSAIMLFAGGWTLARALTNPTVADVLTYTIELTARVVVALCAALVLRFPEENRLFGYVIAAFSFLSLFGGTGAFCFGSLLGVFGAAVILLWLPPLVRSCQRCGTSLPRFAAACPACGALNPVPIAYRQAEATAIALTGVFFVHVATALGAVGPYPFPKFPPLLLLPGVLAEAALLVGAVMAYRRPERSREWGAVIIVGSLLAIFGPYYGFVLGPLFGLGAGVKLFLQRRG